MYWISPEFKPTYLFVLKTWFPWSPNHNNGVKKGKKRGMGFPQLQIAAQHWLLLMITMKAKFSLGLFFFSNLEAYIILSKSLYFAIWKINQLVMSLPLIELALWGQRAQNIHCFK